MKLNTINVTEYTEANGILGVQSFSIDEQGIKEAEEHFKAIIKENGDNITAEELEGFVEDGIFEQGDYQVFLTHST